MEEEKKKKKIYYEVNKRYKQTEKGKQSQKKAVAKSQAKKFINELGTLEELKELQNLIKSKLEEK